jgi:hypothetical protein
MITARGMVARALLAVTILCGTAALSAPAHAAGRWLGSLEFGYDTYTERYSIAEADTLSSIDEARTRLRVGYATGALGRNYALLEGRQYFGESSSESAARALVTRRLGGTAAWVFNLDAELARRGFRDDSAYEFPNDYTRAYARAGLRARAGSQVTVRLDDRVERLDYDQRTEFDYDYTRNILTCMVDFGRDPFRSLSLGARYSTMAIPDSAEIAYHAAGPMVEVRAFGDLRERMYLTIAADRRIYPSDGTRSSFWSILATGLLEWPFLRQWSVEAGADVEDYDYDVTTGAYDDYLETRSYLAINWFDDGLKLGAGPAFAWLSSRDEPQDEYREVGVRLALEKIGSNGLYVSAAYEPGWRDYEAYADDGGAIDNADVIFSDYAFHRVNVFANARLYRTFWLNVLFDWQPEDHDRDGDDATATVGSITLMYVF